MTFENLPVAELLIRLLAGVIFLLQGYDKLFRIKLPGVINAFRGDAERNNIPPSLVGILAYYTSFAEFFGGLMLLAGFCTNYALYALGLDLLLVTFAFSYLQPMWDMKHVFPRFVLVTVLLIMPEEARQFSADHFFFN